MVYNTKAPDGTARDDLKVRSIFLKTIFRSNDSQVYKTAVGGPMKIKKSRNQK